MEIIVSLAAFPVLVALIMLAVRGDSARRVLVSAAAVIMTGGSIAVTVMYFADGEKTFGSGHHAVVYAAAGVFALLAVVIMLIALRNRKYLTALMALVQAAAIALFAVFRSGDIDVGHDLYIDRFSMMIMILVSMAGGLTALYAVRYMKRYREEKEDEKDRSSVFFFSLFLSVAAVMGLVISNDVIIACVCWALLTLCVYMMAGSGGGEAKTGALRSLTVNTFGCLLFSLGVLVLGEVFSTLEFTTAMEVGAVYGDLIAMPAFFMAVACMIMALQLPFSGWFTKMRSMPVPASVMIGSVAAVNAGVFIMVKLSPVLGIGNFAGITVMMVGGITLAASSYMWIRERDAAGWSAHSAVAAAALMTVCAGLGDSAAVWAGIMLMIFNTFARMLIMFSAGCAGTCADSADADPRMMFAKRRKSAGYTAMGVSLLMMSMLEIVILRWSVVSSAAGTGNVLLMVLLCFGAGAVIVPSIRMLADLSTAGSCAEEEKTDICVRITAVLSTAVSIAFPFISVGAVIPYLEGSFGGVSSMMSLSDIITGLVITVFILLIAGGMFRKDCRRKEYGGAAEGKGKTAEGERLMDTYFDVKKITHLGVALSSVMLVIGGGFIIGMITNIMGGAV